MIYIFVHTILSQIWTGVCLFLFFALFPLSSANSFSSKYLATATVLYFMIFLYTDNCGSQLSVYRKIIIYRTVAVAKYFDNCALITVLSWLEKAMAPHSSTLAWRIPWMEEPGRQQSMRLLRVRHDWATSLWLFTFMHWRRKWQPTPMLLPGESQGRWSLVGCHL